MTDAVPTGATWGEPLLVVDVPANHDGLLTEHGVWLRPVDRSRPWRLLPPQPLAAGAVPTVTRSRWHRRNR